MIQLPSLTRKCAVYLLLAAMPSLPGCFKGSDGPLLSFLTNSRLIILLKGTYASDRPLEFYEINSNRIFLSSTDTALLSAGLKQATTTGCTPFVDPLCLPPLSQLPIFLDFGEVRLSSREPGNDELLGVDDEESSQGFWDIASNERQVYCSTTYTLDSSRDNCKLGGVANFYELMNGNGVIYPGRDVAAGIYYHAGVYARALATGWGLRNGVLALSTFDNNDIVGVRITPYVQYDPNIDSTTQQLIPADWFPMHYSSSLNPHGAMIKDDATYTPVVLEIRFNIKENLMVHSFTDEGNRSALAVAFSDWRRPHNDNGADLGLNMGGNVLSRARMFYPDVTSTLTISGGVQSPRHYYALEYSTDATRDIQLPVSATPVRNGSNNTMRNVMAGTYVLQCRYDCKHDGYPELVQSEVGPFEIGTGPGLAAQSLACGCGINPPSGCDADPPCY
ncbi:MAG: hypothetical protein K1X75_14600 [Leptospirales bacterium]|nr:hypothetical protein [Leptospirales bacterium]